MQFSTGRSELNPYIAVVIGLLALAMYVASSGDSVTKLINAAKAETLAAVTPVATVAPTASVAPVASVPPTASVASVSSTPAPTTTVAPSVATSSTTPMSPFVSVKKPETVVATTESPATAAVPATAVPATSTSTATAPSTAASSKAPSSTATSTTAASATAASTTPMSPFVSVSRPTTTSPFSRPSPPLSSVGPMVSTSATTAQSGGESVFSQPSTAAAPVAMATTATVANVAANGSIGSSLLSTILSIFIGIIVFFGLLALLSRLGGVDISAAIKRGVGAQPSLYDITLAQNKLAKDIVPAPAPSAPSVVNNKEVFQVGNGNLTYIEARGACQAQGAKLANYSQIEDAYNNGAEWCSYGWSEGQMALFPTQKETYERLQEGCSGDQNSCGRPGINGGYIANPNVRFAANCYGKKPKATKAEMRATKQGVISPQDSEAQRIAQLYKQADKQFKIRPFAPGEWSEMEDTSNASNTKPSADDLYLQELYIEADNQYNKADKNMRDEWSESKFKRALDDKGSEAKRIADRLYNKTKKQI